MSSEHAEEMSPSHDSQPHDTEPQGTQSAQPPGTGSTTSSATRTSAAQTGNAAQNGAAPQAATVIVRGETVANAPGKSPSGNPPATAAKTAAPKKVSEAKAKLQSRLPSLDDFDDIGVQKQQIVVRDGKPDLAFTGELVASAAPASASSGHWEELRVYKTSAGK